MVFSCKILLASGSLHGFRVMSNGRLSGGESELISSTASPLQDRVVSVSEPKGSACGSSKDSLSRRA